VILPGIFSAANDDKCDEQLNTSRKALLSGLRWSVDEQY
jgi:hypothetical protein